MQFTAEQIKLAQSAKTADELLVVAKDAGVSISPEQAQQFLSANSNADLTEEDLDTVAGGCDTTPLNRAREKYNGVSCKYCGGTNTEVENLFGALGMNIRCNDCQKNFSYNG